MENDTLKVTASRVADKVFNRFRRLLREQTHVDIAHRRVDCRRVGKWRRAGALVGCGGGNALFLACWAFVEDIAVAGFVVPEMNLEVRFCKPWRDAYAYSGSERVNR